MCAQWRAAFHHLGFNRLAGRIGDTIDCFKKRDNSGAIDQRFRAHGIEDGLTGQIKPRRVGGNRRIRELEQQRAIANTRLARVRTSGDGG